MYFAKWLHPRMGEHLAQTRALHLFCPFEGNDKPGAELELKAKPSSGKSKTVVLHEHPVGEWTIEIAELPSQQIVLKGTKTNRTHLLGFVLASSGSLLDGDVFIFDPICIDGKTSPSGDDYKRALKIAVVNLIDCARNAVKFVEPALRLRSLFSGFGASFAAWSRSEEFIGCLLDVIVDSFSLSQAHPFFAAVLLKNLAIYFPAALERGLGVNEINQSIGYIHSVLGCDYDSVLAISLIYIIHNKTISPTSRLRCAEILAVAYAACASNPLAWQPIFDVFDSLCFTVSDLDDLIKTSNSSNQRRLEFVSLCCASQALSTLRKSRLQQDKDGTPQTPILLLCWRFVMLIEQQIRAMGGQGRAALRGAYSNLLEETVICTVSHHAWFLSLPATDLAPTASELFFQSLQRSLNRKLISFDQVSLHSLILQPRCSNEFRTFLFQNSIAYCSPSIVVEYLNRYCDLTDAAQLQLLGSIVAAHTDRLLTTADQSNMDYLFCYSVFLINRIKEKDPASWETLHRVVDDVWQSCNLKLTREVITFKLIQGIDSSIQSAVKNFVLSRCERESHVSIFGAFEALDPDTALGSELVATLTARVVKPLSWNFATAELSIDELWPRILRFSRKRGIDLLADQACPVPEWEPFVSKCQPLAREAIVLLDAILALDIPCRSVQELLGAPKDAFSNFCMILLALGRGESEDTLLSLMRTFVNDMFDGDKLYMTMRRFLNSPWFVNLCSKNASFGAAFQSEMEQYQQVRESEKAKMLRDRVSGLRKLADIQIIELLIGMEGSHWAHLLPAQTTGSLSSLRPAAVVIYKSLDSRMATEDILIKNFPHITTVGDGSDVAQQLAELRDLAGLAASPMELLKMDLVQWSRFRIVEKFLPQLQASWSNLNASHDALTDELERHRGFSTRKPLRLCDFKNSALPPLSASAVGAVCLLGNPASAQLFDWLLRETDKSFGKEINVLQTRPEAAIAIPLLGTAQSVWRALQDLGYNSFFPARSASRVLEMLVVLDSKAPLFSEKQFIELRDHLPKLQEVLSSIRDVSQIDVLTSRAVPLETGMYLLNVSADKEPEFALMAADTGEPVLLEALRSLRDRLLLASSGDQLFLEQFQSAKRIFRAAKELAEAFHLGFCEFQLVIPASRVCSVETSIREILDRELRLWRAALKECRSKYPLMLFLSSLQTQRLAVDLIHKRTLSLMQLMQVVGISTNFVASHLDQALRLEGIAAANLRLGKIKFNILPVGDDNERQMRSHFDAHRQLLYAIGRYLHRFKTSWEGRPSLRWMKHSQCNITHYVPAETIQNNDWKRDVLILYLGHADRLPLAQELLLCKPTTTTEELKLFFQRASKFDQLLLCMACPERLHPIALSYLLRQLRRLAAPAGDKSWLSRICILSANAAASTYHGCVQQKIVESSNLISRMQVELSKVGHTVVFSSDAGGGKSFLASKILENRLVLRCPLFLSTTVTRFVTLLNSVPQANALHLDIQTPSTYALPSPEMDGGAKPSRKWKYGEKRFETLSEPDDVLFSLLLLRVVQDHLGNTFTLAPSAKVVIEISVPSRQNPTEPEKSKVAGDLGPKFSTAAQLPRHVPDWDVCRSNSFATIKKTFSIYECDADIFEAFAALSCSRIRSSIAHNLLGSGVLAFAKRSEVLERSLMKSALSILAQKLESVLSSPSLSWITLREGPIPFFDFTNQQAFFLSASLPKSGATPFWKQIDSSSALSTLTSITTKSVSVPTMTVDFALLFSWIWSNLLAENPVLLIGETGSGKTYLFQQMERLVDCKVFFFEVHGGVTEQHIIRFWSDIVLPTLTSVPSKRIVVFFDEVNTTTASGLIKEIICDRCCAGQKLKVPEGFKVMFAAACNPYRERSKLTAKSQKLRECGLIPTESKLMIEPQHRLVYKIFPLPETLAQYAIDISVRSEEEENESVRLMVKSSQLSPKVKEQLPTVILVSQKFHRHHGFDSDVAAVSLRDVKRCIELCGWFERVVFPIPSNINPFATSRVSSSTLCILWACCINYYFRLLREERDMYLKLLSRALPEFASSNEMFQYLMDSTSGLASCFELYSDVVQTPSICENILLAFVCVQVNIPLLFVGKPGTSKSLATSIVLQQLKGRFSINDFLKNFGLVQSFWLQCSTATSAQAIKDVFADAKRFRSRSADSIPVVVLEELGLTEMNPSLPLKVLHSLLEEDSSTPLEGRVAFVGLSNWMLDPAKLNRCVTVLKEELVVSECKELCARLFQRAKVPGADALASSISLAYSIISGSKGESGFNGLRDLFCFINALASQALAGDPVTPSSILSAARLYFGAPNRTSLQELVRVFAEQLQSVGLVVPHLPEPEPSLPYLRRVISTPGRHLLILSSHGPSAFSQLEDMIDVRRVVRIQSGPFTADTQPTAQRESLGEIKRAMREGKIVIMPATEPLVECLYEVLNNRYMKVGSTFYTRIAIGRTFETCDVLPSFRMVFTCPTSELDRLPPPLLSRLQKHWIDPSESLSFDLKDLVRELTEWVNSILQSASVRRLRSSSLIFGYSDGCISSLVTILSRRFVSKDDLRQACKRQILALLTPAGSSALVAACTVNEESQLETAKAALDSYEASSRFSSLMDVANKSSLLWANPKGSTLRVVIFSPNITDLSALAQFGPHQVIEMASVPSSAAFRKELHSFFSDDKTTVIALRCIESDLFRTQSALELTQICDEVERNVWGSKHAVGLASAPKHVIIVVRVGATSSGFVTFSTGWNMLYLDSLSPSSAFPARRLSELPQTNLTDLAKRLRGVCQEHLRCNFTQLMAKLVPSGGDSGIRQRLFSERLTSAPQLLDDPQFMTDLHNRIVDTIHRSERTRAHWTTRWIKSDFWALSSLPVYTQIKSYICKTYLDAAAWVLSKWNTNNGLVGMARNRALWQTLTDIFSLNLNSYDPAIDRVQQPFIFEHETRFPFSRNLFDVLQRGVREQRNLQSLLEEKTPQFASLKPTAAQIGDYIADFVRFVSAESLGLNAELVEAFLHSALVKHTGVLHVFHVHFAYSRYSQLIAELLKLENFFIDLERGDEDLVTKFKQAANRNVNLEDIVVEIVDHALNSFSHLRRQPLESDDHLQELVSTYIIKYEFHLLISCSRILSLVSRRTKELDDRLKSEFAFCLLCSALVDLPDGISFIKAALLKNVSTWDGFQEVRLNLAPSSALEPAQFVDRMIVTQFLGDLLKLDKLEARKYLELMEPMLGIDDKRTPCSASVATQAAHRILTSTSKSARLPRKLLRKWAIDCINANPKVFLTTERSAMAAILLFGGLSSQKRCQKFCSTSKQSTTDFGQAFEWMSYAITAIQASAASGNVTAALDFFRRILPSAAAQHLQSFAFHSLRTILVHSDYLELSSYLNKYPEFSAELQRIEMAPSALSKRLFPSTSQFLPNFSDLARAVEVGELFAQPQFPCLFAYGFLLRHIIVQPDLTRRKSNLEALRRASYSWHLSSAETSCLSKLLSAEVLSDGVSEETALFAIWKHIGLPLPVGSVRLAMHIVSVILAIISSPDGSLFRQLVDNPRAFRNCLFPGSHEASSAVPHFHAGDVTRIYRHRCGYVYAVGNCGGLNETRRCPSCPGTLGAHGESTPIEADALAGLMVRTGFCFGPCAPVRGLDFDRVYLLRSFSQAALMGAVLFGSPDAAVGVTDIPLSPPNFLSELTTHLVADIENWGRSTGTSLTDAAWCLEVAAVKMICLSSRFGMFSCSPASLTTAAHRDAWEGRVARDAGFLASHEMQDAARRYTEEFSKLSTSPLLWQFFEGAITIDDIPAELQQELRLTSLIPLRRDGSCIEFFLRNPSYRELYPVVDFFVSERATISALRLLPQAIEFCKKLHTYCGTLSFEECSALALADVLPHLDTPAGGFKAFVWLWNFFRSGIEKLGCSPLKLPEATETLKTVVVLNAPTREEPQTRVTVLMSFICDVHNALLRALIERMGGSASLRPFTHSVLPEEAVSMVEDAPNRRIREVFTTPLSFVSEAHLMGFDSLMDDRVVLEQQRKFQYFADGQVSWDIEGYQLELVQTCFTGKSLISCSDFPSISFSGEVAEPRRPFQEVIQQRRLHPDRCSLKEWARACDVDLFQQLITAMRSIMIQTHTLTPTPQALDDCAFVCKRAGIDLTPELEAQLFKLPLAELVSFFGFCTRRAGFDAASLPEVYQAPLQDLAKSEVDLILENYPAIALHELRVALQTLAATIIDESIDSNTPLSDLLEMDQLYAIHQTLSVDSVVLTRRHFWFSEYDPESLLPENLCLKHLASLLAALE